MWIIASLLISMLHVIDYSIVECQLADQRHTLSCRPAYLPD